MNVPWCFQFSRKLNGGNQALAAFFSELTQRKGSSLVLTGNGFIQFFKIATKNRYQWVIVSDPLCSIILFILGFRKVIHFVQSDDLILFKEHGFFFNFFYQRIYFLMMRLTSWERVFNSEYSRIKFNLRFGTLYSQNAVVPLLGLVDLFPPRPRDSVRTQTVSKAGALWIGSKHGFKGGKVFARIVKKINIRATMIFSGELPRWAHALNEFCKVERNLNRDEIFSQLREASCYVYTSKFDSFALPIFEALYVGCPVVALRNECIHLNNTDQYVWVVENEIELETVLHRFTQNRIDLSRFPDWEFERKRLRDWIEGHFGHLQSI